MGEVLLLRPPSEPPEASGSCQDTSCLGWRMDHRRKSCPLQVQVFPLPCASELVALHVLLFSCSSPSGVLLSPPRLALGGEEAMRKLCSDPASAFCLHPPLRFLGRGPRSLPRSSAVVMDSGQSRPFLKSRSVSSSYSFLSPLQ